MQWPCPTPRHKCGPRSICFLSDHLPLGVQQRPMDRYRRVRPSAEAVRRWCPMDCTGSKHVFRPRDLDPDRRRSQIVPALPYCTGSVLRIMYPERLEGGEGARWQRSSCIHTVSLHQCVVVAPDAQPRSSWTRSLASAAGSACGPAHGRSR